MVVTYFIYFHLYTRRILLYHSGMQTSTDERDDEGHQVNIKNHDTHMRYFICFYLYIDICILYIHISFCLQNHIISLNAIIIIYIVRQLSSTLAKLLERPDTGSVAPPASSSSDVVNSTNLVQCTLPLVPRHLDQVHRM